MNNSLKNNLDKKSSKFKTIKEKLYIKELKKKWKENKTPNVFTVVEDFIKGAEPSSGRSSLRSPACIMLTGVDEPAHLCAR